MKHLPQITAELLAAARVLDGRLCAQEGDVFTVADPFPVVHEGILYLFAEIEGHRPGGAYFKSLGVFRIDSDTTYLGSVWPDPAQVGSEGRYSFPYVFRHAGRYWMLPDATQPDREVKRIELLSCAMADFPFGWGREQGPDLDGLVNPSDKVVFRHEGLWWLFVSDAERGGTLKAWWAAEFGDWSPVARPVLNRTMIDRIANRYLPPRLYPIRPWRLGGGPVMHDGLPCLPVQHVWTRKQYGEVVSLLRLDRLEPGRVAARLDPRPFLLSGEAAAWASQGIHHIALTRDGDRLVCAIDGFDGRGWRTGVVTDAAPSLAGLEPVPDAP